MMERPGAGRGVGNRATLGWAVGAFLLFAWLRTTEQWIPRARAYAVRCVGADAHSEPAVRG